MITLNPVLYQIAEIDELNSESYKIRHTDPERSKQLASEAILLCKEQMYLLGEAQALLNTGFYYLNKGDHNLAYEQFINALFIFKDEQNDGGIASAHYNLGVLNFRLANYENALTEINQSLTIRLKDPDNPFLGKCYYQMAIIRYQLKDLKGALDATEKALEYERKLGEQSGVAATLTVQGRIYTDTNQFELAEKCLNESSNMRKMQGEYIASASNIFYIIHLWIKQGLHQKARAKMEEASSVFDNLDFPYGQAQCMHLRASLEIQKGNSTLVIQYLEEAVAIAAKFNLKEQLSQAYLLFSNYQKSQGNLETALHYFQLYHQTLLENYTTQTKRMFENIKLHNEINNARIESALLRTNNTDLTFANQVISEMNTNMKDSLIYAKRIQKAIFPRKANLDATFEKYFLLENPKTIVSGDFLWVQKQGEATYVAVADCTGHGVPGAILSVYAYESLNRAFKNQKTNDPARLLNHIRDYFLHDFQSEFEELKDGMDIAIIRIEGNEMQYASAFRPIYVLRDNTIIDLKGERQPVGLYPIMTPFINNTFTLHANDQIVLFTDGITDQQGGLKGKKLRPVGLKELLLTHHKKEMAEQGIVLAGEFKNWSDQHEQVDDSLLFSFKV